MSGVLRLSLEIITMNEQDNYLLSLSEHLLKQAEQKARYIVAIAGPPGNSSVFICSFPFVRICVRLLLLCVSRRVIEKLNDAQRLWEDYSSC